MVWKILGGGTQWDVVDTFGVMCDGACTLVWSIQIFAFLPEVFLLSPMFIVWFVRIIMR